MKIYSDTITHEVLDVKTNTTGLPIYTTTTMYGTYDTYEATMVDSGEVDDNGDAIMIQDTDELGELLYTTITNTYIKEGVVKWDVELDDIGRDKFSIMRSTYWDGAAGLAIPQADYLQEIEDYESNGTCTTKDNEIYAKANLEVQEENTAVLWVTVQRLGGDI